jgi:hypothetical protein
MHPDQIGKLMLPSLLDIHQAAWVHQWEYLMIHQSQQN